MEPKFHAMNQISEIKKPVKFEYYPAEMRNYKAISTAAANMIKKEKWAQDIVTQQKIEKMIEDPAFMRKVIFMWRELDKIDEKSGEPIDYDEQEMKRTSGLVIRIKDAIFNQ